MKILSLNILFVCFASAVLAQTPLESAGYLYEDKNYVDAAKAYEHVVEKIKNPSLKNEVYGKIGNAYFFTQDYKNAEIWYKRAIDGKTTAADVYLNYGDIKMYFSDYPNAIDLF